MASRKQRDKNTKKGALDKTTTESGFVIYDPDNPPFQRLHLCEYLLELSDLEEGTGGDGQSEPEERSGA